MKRLAVSVLCWASVAAAETPMTGAEFEAYVEGRIMSFGSEGDPTYGVEQYLPNRRVIWSSSSSSHSRGSMHNPPLEPPNGASTSAHL